MNAPVLRAWEETGDTTLLRRAFHVALDWSRFHDTKKATMSWMDMAVGLRAAQLAYFLDQIRLQNLLPTESESRRLDRLIAGHTKRLSNPKFLTMNNHGLFQAYGLKMIEVATSAKESIADTLLDQVLQTQFTDEGVHKENSPDYHQLISKVLASFNENGRLSNDVVATIAKAAAHQPAFVFPNGMMAAVGDTAGKGTPPLEQERLRVDDFSASGYLAVRKKSSMLFVTGMAQSYAHKHADELSFQFFHNGEFVFIDGGKYSYARDEWRDYFVSADAHNTISLVGAQIPIRSVALTGSLLDKPTVEDGKVSITGHVERKLLFKHSRTIVYDPDSELLIQDKLSSTEEQTFVSTLLLAPGLKPTRTNSGFELTLKSGQLLHAKTDAELEFVTGQKDPILGWWSPSYGKMEPTVAVRAYRTGKQALIKWSITFKLLYLCVFDDGTFSAAAAAVGLLA